MVKPRVVLAVMVSVSARASQTGHAQQKGAKHATNASSLTPLDYIEIQQLGRRFAWALDSGDNYGYAFADLFTLDASFVDTSEGPSGRTYQGRDNLAALARANQRGPVNLNHFGMNHVITPTADGAIGKAYRTVWTGTRITASRTRTSSRRAPCSVVPARRDMTISRNWPLSNHTVRNTSGTSSPTT